MSQTELNDIYKTFVRDAVNLRKQGSISDNNLHTMIVGASSFMISQKLTNDFNSYAHNKFESHFHNSIRQVIHF